MPFTGERIAEYYDQALMRDWEALRTDHDRLAEEAGELYQTSWALQYLAENHPRDRVSSTLPLPSHVLLYDAYVDLGKPKRIVSTKSLKLAGETLLGQAGLSVGEPAVQGTYERGAEPAACPQAEKYFYDTVQQIRDSQFRSQRLISVYHTEDGLPIAMRKRHLESSALLLEPLLAGGLPIVPGTILKVSNKMGAKKTGEYGYLGFDVATYQLPDEVVVTPARISPWAYDDPLDRSLFAVSGFTEPVRVFPDRARMVTSLELKDFRSAARQIIELCGVSSN